MSGEFPNEAGVKMAGNPDWRRQDHLRFCCLGLARGEGEEVGRMRINTAES